MKFKASVLFLFFFSSLISCKKDFPDVQDISAGLIESQNPFIYVGSLHNDALDVVRQQYFQKNKETSIHSESQNIGYRNESLDYAAIDQSTVDYFVGIVQASSFPSTNVPLLREKSLEFIDVNIAPYYNACNDLSCLTDMQQVLSITTLSTSARTTLESMVAEVSNSDNLTSGLNIITTYENQITATYTLYERNILLIGCAVYRSSLQYWYNVYVNGGTSWTSSIFPRSGWSDAKDVASADLGGAVVGAGIGIYSGVTSGALVFGPGGVVATAVGGAVLGGARASAAAGLGKLIRSWW